MLNTSWVIDFGWCAAPETAVRLVGETSETLRMIEMRRQASREMFATTRTLLAEARAVLAATSVATAPARKPGHSRHASTGHAVAAWHPSLD
jgi:hypothetical protein